MVIEGSDDESPSDSLRSSGLGFGVNASSIVEDLVADMREAAMTEQKGEAGPSSTHEAESTEGVEDETTVANKSYIQIFMNDRLQNGNPDCRPRRSDK